MGVARWGFAGVGGVLLTLAESSALLPESEERRGVVREDAEATQGPEPRRHHLGDDQEEGEGQEGAAAPHPGGGGEKVRGGVQS